MKNKRESSSVPRRAEDRRGFDCGTPAACAENRIVTEGRTPDLDLISGSDWLACKVLLGAYQRAIDQSFQKVFGSA